MKKKLGIILILFSLLAVGAALWQMFQTARLEEELLFSLEPRQTAERQKVEPLRHAAEEGVAAVLGEQGKPVLQRVEIEAGGKLAVARERTGHVDGSHTMGALLSFPLPRGYFAGVGFSFSTTTSVRLP